jgi:hypothetical protein
MGSLGERRAVIAGQVAMAILTSPVIVRFSVALDDARRNAPAGDVCNFRTTFAVASFQKNHSNGELTGLVVTG